MRARTMASGISKNEKIVSRKMIQQIHRNAVNRLI
jgi:hypothetical protein